MKTFRLTPEAEADLDEITDYYRDKSPAYGRRLVDDIERRCRHLASFPKTGKPRDRLGQGVRTSAVPPYVISFRPTDDGIQVLRVIHGSRDVDADMIPE